MRDPLGLTPWQRREAERTAEAPPRPEDVHVVHISADPDGATITDHGRYCPAPIPCLGRPAVGIAVPVRADGKEQVGEVLATYCPRCKGWKADERETAGKGSTT